MVLGGHSLGGSVVTAYATWNFAGHAGADQLAGLVYIDGGSGPPAAVAQLAPSSHSCAKGPAHPGWPSAASARHLPGLFNATGSGGVRGPQRALAGPAVPTAARRPQAAGPGDQRGQYGYALNVGTSPASLIAAQAHLGNGVGPRGPTAFTAGMAPGRSRRCIGSL